MSDAKMTLKVRLTDRMAAGQAAYRASVAHLYRPCPWRLLSEGTQERWATVAEAVLSFIEQVPPPPVAKRPE